MTSNNVDPRVLLFTRYARVLVQGDLSFVQHIVEGWPTTTCIELGTRTEEVLTTNHAYVCPRFGMLVEAAWKGED